MLNILVYLDQFAFGGSFCGESNLLLSYDLCDLLCVNNAM